MSGNGSGSVLVVGGGIAGIQASLDLAEAGFRVNLVESSPTIGGVMAQLDKTFPTNDCSMCIMSPKLVDCARHLNINLLTLSEVESVRGGPGDFTVRVRRRARYVDESKCTGCGECEKHCPVSMPNEFDERLGSRHAIYRPFPQAAPNVFVIQKRGKSPCSAACPAGCNAHGYVALIRERKFKEAVELIRQRIPLPAVCGRVCGLCEEECNRNNLDQPLQIRALKRFASDWEMQHQEEMAAALAEAAPKGKKKGKVASARMAKVAIIGSGPAGLTAAHDLAGLGYQPVVFESMPKTGGMLRYGIPQYRLPEEVLDYEVEVIRRAGVQIKTGVAFGQEISLQSLRQDGYKAIFLAAGTQRSRRLAIEGEQLHGVLPAIEFLRYAGNGRSAAAVKGKVVAVIGGGNTAIDCARTARRLGARQALLVYRRTRVEMPAQAEEVEAAEEEGIKLSFLLAPQKIVGREGKAKQLVCSRMRLGPPDASDRRSPVPIEGEIEKIPVDVVIAALGQELDTEWLQGEGAQIELARGLIKVDPVSLQTNLPGVFAGGDAVGAGGYVVHAIAHGHTAAESIDRYLDKRDLKEGRSPEPTLTATMPEGYHETVARTPLPQLQMKQRLAGFGEVELGLTEEQAVAEASRCLNCGVCCECEQCVAHCEAGAIDHSQKDQIEELRVGAILVAAGCEKYDPKAMYHLGYGRYPDVVTSIQFERILSASGPFGGHIQRPSDGVLPRKIAFIQCVGSRDPASGNEHCSSVCCMYAIKEAVIAKEHEHEIEPTIFYMDIRAYGKDFDRYFERAQRQYGVRFKRARPSGVVRDEHSGRLLLEYEDETGKVIHEEFDLVVLSIGFQGGSSLQKLGRQLGLPLNRHGFIATEAFNPVQTKVPGVFICGPAQEPKDIPETVMQASAASAAAAETLAASRWTEVLEKTYPEERDVSGEPVRVGVFVCHCGINIGGTVRVPEVVEYAKTLPGVAYAEANLYTCSQDTQAHIREMIGEHHLNRVVVASCTPRTHEPLFQETIREAGLNRHLFEMANIRDQCSWIHMGLAAEATQKAEDLLRMAVAKARLVEALPTIPLDVKQSALVIGGGPAGMSAALSLADQGFQVDLVERERELGGNLNRVLSTLEGRDTGPQLARMVARIREHERIRVHLSSRVEAVGGFVGQFKSTLSGNGGGPLEVEHGVAIIATGARESRPQEYLYGQDGRIKTGQEFESLLQREPTEKLPDRVVFIQCVGSREEEHLYCSRVCCRESVKNALALKKRRPEAEVYVLFRDLRTYGFAERYYEEARQAGVTFLRYEPEGKPQVQKRGNRLDVVVRDLQSGQTLSIRDVQALVLAARIDAEPENEQISQLFKVPLNQDGFFLEAHVKLRPVDFATEGVYLAGMAHNPKTIEEAIVQGRAAAARAATVISKDKYLAEATIAAVNEDLCDGCGICVGVCEYSALEIEEKPDGTKIVRLNEAACKGCGCCVAACPSGAMEQKGYKNDQIMAEIDAALL
jgi:heterodisulfide reductase subunit A-like polyferredoxin